MRKLIKLIKDRSGASLVAGAGVACVLFVVSFIAFEALHLYIVELGIRDDVQNAITTACTENYTRLYNGIREGYTGGYKLVGSNWTEDISTGDVYEQLDSLLGTRVEGSEHVKYNGNQIAYSISDLNVQMTNTPFAPNNSDQETKFTGVAYLTLRVPLGFGWGAVPPMQVQLKIKSGYMAKF